MPAAPPCATSRPISRRSTRSRAPSSAALRRAATTLPAPPREMESGGYTYLHRGTAHCSSTISPSRQLERLRGPGPAVRARHAGRARLARMGAPRRRRRLGTARSWQTSIPPPFSAELARSSRRGHRRAPADVRRRTDDDLRLLLDTDRGARPLRERDDRRLVAGASAGAALARTLLTRMPDYQANLLAARFWTGDEAEAYVRHNVRTLRGHYEPGQTWRMLVRYLYECQYLRFSAVADRAPLLPVEHLVRRRLHRHRDPGRIEARSRGFAGGSASARPMPSTRAASFSRRRPRSQVSLDSARPDYVSGFRGLSVGLSASASWGRGADGPQREKEEGHAR